MGDSTSSVESSNGDTNHITVSKNICCVNCHFYALFIYLQKTKKNQNRIAASRYRSKCRSQRKELSAERHRLELENGKLKKVVEDKQNEIMYLKRLMIEIKQRSG